jgi:hypothetical protein
MIFAGGLITGGAAIGLNVKFVQYFVGPRRRSTGNRPARLVAALTFVESGLTHAVIAFAGLIILFLGLVVDGENRWILALPVAMLIWTVGVKVYTRRLSSRVDHARGTGGEQL